MDIQIKDSGTTWGKNKIFHLLINGKKFSNENFYLEADGMYSSDYLKEKLITPFLNLNCVEFPENIKFSFIFDNPPLSELDYGEAGGIDFFRKGNKFSVHLNVWVPDNQLLKSYFNPYILMKYAVRAGNKKRLLKCYVNNLIELDSGFTYISKAEGNISLKIEEAKSLINAVFQEATKEMFEVMSKQLASARLNIRLC